MLYLFTQGVCPQGYALPSPSRGQSMQEMESVLGKIPGSFGSVADLWVSPQTDKPFVLLLQDAHGQAQAQRNTQRLLNFIDQQIPLKTFFVEGGAGRLDPEKLRLFQEAPMNLAAAKWFLREGDLGGVELFLLEKAGVTQKLKKNREFFAQGVEDQALYLENLRLFEKIARQRPEIKTWLASELLTLEKKASQTLNPDLLSFFRAWIGYEETHTHLESYLAVLEASASKNAGIDLADARSQEAWPMLVRFSELKRRQTRLDYEAAAQDAQRVRVWAKEKGLEYGPLLQHLERFSSRSGNTTPADLRLQWETFYRLSKPLGFSFESYSALSLWEGARILESEIDAKLLMTEASNLRDQILRNMTLKPAEHEMIQTYRDYLLLQKLFQLRLERSDFEKIKKLDGFYPFPSAGVQDVFNNALQFYKTAQAREQRMVELVLKSSDKKGVKVFVAGGFHTAALTQKIREAGISYAVLSPHMSQVEDENRYWNSMMRDKPLFAAPVFKPMRLETVLPVSHIRVANMLADWQGRLPSRIGNRRERMFERIHKAGQRAGATLIESREGYTTSRSEVRKREVLLGGVRWRRYEAGADKPWVLAVEPFDDHAMADLIGRVNLDWIHPDDEPLTTAKILQAIDESDKPYRFVLGFVNYGFKKELFEKMNERLVAAGLADLPKGLPVMSTGINNVDLAAATDLGFQVTNASGILTQSMLEM
ncbi:MAG: hypothetical protein KBC91_08595, partial [Candidatus Omnitrophica bacterium]|nr:hypothetical protein [Candidatus Omnitrophota bacterium]